MRIFPPDVNGECEVRSESNAKLQIVVNEGAATVKAKATVQGQGQQPKSPKCNRVLSPKNTPKCSNRTAGGSESHSDVGSSCSDEVGEDEEEDEDEDTARRRREQGGDSVAFEILSSFLLLVIFKF